MKLLLVEDDRDMILMLKNWLNAHGYEIYCASTCEKASVLWLEQHPDLVIIDDDLSQQNLLAWCCKMRKIYDTLVFVMSSTRTVENELRWLEWGADNYLLKPFFPANCWHASGRFADADSMQLNPALQELLLLEKSRWIHIAIS